MKQAPNGAMNTTDLLNQDCTQDDVCIPSLFGMVSYMAPSLLTPTLFMTLLYKSVHSSLALNSNAIRDSAHLSQVLRRDVFLIFYVDSLSDHNRPLRAVTSNGVIIPRGRFGDRARWSHHSELHVASIRLNTTLPLRVHTTVAAGTYRCHPCALAY